MSEKKPFAWSFSALQTFEACQLQHQQTKVLKRFKEDENENMLWGNRVHKAMEMAIKKGDELPIEMRRYQPYIDIAMKHAQGGTIKAEQQLALDRGFQPCGWFDKSAWLRTKIDVDILRADRGLSIMFDWKTGKIKEDSVQLGVSATVMLMHHIEVDVCQTVFVWLGNDETTPQVWHRDDLKALWAGLMPRVQAMENAYNTGIYHPNPSGLCRRHCLVSTCEYHGKGSY